MQFFSIFFSLPVYGKILFIITLLLIFIWTYVDANKRGLHGWLWGLILLVFPIMLPVYIFIRPRFQIGFCNNCFRIMPKDSSECFYCEETSNMSRKGSVSIILYVRRYLLRVLLEIIRTYHRALGVSLFLFRKKFLRLNYKLSSYYPWGMCHQLVATEGPDRGIPRKTLTYGETLYLSAWKVFVLAGIEKKDVFYDLGSGTGKVAFFCNILYDIETVGIDAIPTFIEYSNKIKTELQFEKVTFIEGNFLELDLSRGTVFFIVSTAFDPFTRSQLAEKFKESPPGTRIVTVTHKLDVPHLKVEEEVLVLFSWGYETLFLHVRV